MFDEYDELTPEQEVHMIEFIRNRQIHYDKALIQDVAIEMSMLLFKERMKKEYGKRHKKHS